MFKCFAHPLFLEKVLFLVPFLLVFSGCDTFFGDHVSVSFGKKVIITFGCERKVCFFSLHESGSFVGEDEIIILSPDPYYGVCAQVSLLYQVKRITFDVIRQFVY